MSEIVEQFYTELRENNGPFLAAQKEDQAAQEKTAAAAKATAVETKAATASSATAWGRLGAAIRHEGASAQAVWHKTLAIGKMSMLGLVAVGAVSVKWAADFQSQMALIGTQAMQSQAEVDRLSKSVLNLAPTVGIGPTELAKGLYHIESAGLSGSQAMSVLAAAAKLSAIGLSDMDSSAQALVATLQPGFKDIKNANDAMALLNATVGIGDMRMGQLVAAMATGAPLAFRTAGLGMIDFSAALATLTDNAVPADEAATRLRMSVALLAAPSHQATKALTAIGLGADEAGRILSGRDKELAKYGITVAKLARDLSQPNGLLVAMADLKEHLKGLGTGEQKAVLEKAFGGGRTSGAIETMLVEFDKLQSKYALLGTSSSRAAQAQTSWQRTQATTRQQMHQLGATVQTLGIQLGQWLLPPLTKFVSFLATHQTVLKVFFAILVAGMVAFTVAVIANTVAMLANPVVWIIIGIVAAVALLVFGIYELVKHWKTVWGWIKRIGVDIWHGLVDAWHWLLHTLKAGALWVHDHVVGPIVHFFAKYLVEPIKFYLKILVAVWRFAWGFLSVIIGDFRRAWNHDWAMIVAIGKWAWDHGIKQVVGFIIDYGVHPVVAAIRWLSHAWSVAWAWIVKKAHEAWLGLKVIWSYVDKYGIKPIKQGISWLGDEWERIWKAIGTAVDRAWAKIKPIFDKIGGGISTIKSGFSDFLNSPGKAGAKVAHMLGFAEGGWVPGPIGAPRLAVVHGGEFVISRHMMTQAGTATASSGSVRAGSPLPSFAASNAGGGTTVIPVYLDGKKIYTAVVPHAQRNKNRNHSSFLG